MKNSKNMSAHHSTVPYTHVSMRTRSTGAFRTNTKEYDQVRPPTTLPPRFSVIICTYNRRSMVLTALASLRKQTLPSKYFEVIVVDNGSVDGTFNAIQTYLSADSLHRRSHEGQWRAQCLLEIRNGLAYARNAGVTAASGEIVVFLDDDVIVDPSFLEHLYASYEETQADAIGGCVELYWESQKPYWMTHDLVDTYGYYRPFRSRTRLPNGINFSNSCFSINRAVLQRIGGFSPFLTKRLHAPINVEAADICRRLRSQNCTLWYEPAAVVAHCVSHARLARPFLVGRAYWQGRSEILAQYADIERYSDAAGSSFIQTIRSILPELKIMVHIFLFHRLLLSLARKPMSERIIAAMAQARSWGHIQQQFMLSNHAPATLDQPFVLMVRAHAEDAVLQIQALRQLGVYCTTSVADIPLPWLWRHRAHPEKSIGIIHFYRPGAFQLNHWRRQRLLLKLWIAQHLGIYVVSTDAGGWWHNTHNSVFASKRAFERKVFACSQSIYTFTRHPEKFYREYAWQNRVQFLAHPGLRATLSVPKEQTFARAQLGIRPETSFVFLCLVYLHTEREIIQCIEAFSEMRSLLLKAEATASFEPQLLLVGTPRDKNQSARIMQRAALNPSIHLSLAYKQEDLPIYISATNAIIMPYFAVKAAGIPEIAMLFYSYERIVISPNLPRFHGLLPPHAGILYNPNSRSSLVQALLMAPNRLYQHSAREASALDYKQSWQNYAAGLVDMYKALLAPPLS